MAKDFAETEIASCQILNIGIYNLFICNKIKVNEKKKILCSLPKSGNRLFFNVVKLLLLLIKSTFNIRYNTDVGEYNYRYYDGSTYTNIK